MKFFIFLSVIVVCLLVYELNNPLWIGVEKREHKTVGIFGYDKVDDILLFEQLEKINTFAVVVDKRGRIHAMADDGSSRFYSWSDTGGIDWSPPVTVAESLSSSRSGDDIQLAVKDQQLIIVWKDKGEFPGWGRAQMAISNDAGKNWSLSENPVGGDAGHNQGYFNLLADKDSFHFMWLDDRGETGASQQLRHAVSNDGFDWREDQLIDGDACTCCGLSSRQFGNDLLVLYRSIEPRDMKMAIYEMAGKNIKKGTSGWRDGGRVGEFDWAFTGCPHQGGSLAITGQGSTAVIHSAVWTGRNGMIGLHYLVSMNGGISWKYRGQIGAAGSGNVHMETVNDQVVIAWHELVGHQHYINVVTMSAEGLQQTKRHKEINHYSYPRTVIHKDTAKLFWLEKGQRGRAGLKVIAVDTGFNKTDVGDML